jgi:hypothetical protein
VKTPGTWNLRPMPKRAMRYGGKPEMLIYRLRLLSEYGLREAFT